jgi:type II secretory pathway component PulF
MKYDEFAFFNQQLALMLRDGIPLEGALRRLCAEMREGPVRQELAALEADLAKGTPLAEALAPRQLPELYKRMVLVGTKSGDLPGALTMLADYFQRQSNTWSRLKTMLVYPLIVIIASFIISLLMAAMWTWVIRPGFLDIFGGIGMRMPSFTMFVLSNQSELFWTFPLLQGLLAALVIGVMARPTWRGQMLWRLPAFKEASVARVAGALKLLLSNGVSLPDALDLVGQLESSPLAALDLQRWRANLAGGMTKFADLAASSRLFPPMFVWVVGNAGEDLAGGFQRAAEIYQARAHYRTEVALYAVLPIAALFLGAVVLSLAMMVLSLYLPMISMLNGMFVTY